MIRSGEEIISTCSLDPWTVVLYAKESIYHYTSPEKGLILSSCLSALVRNVASVDNITALLINWQIYPK